MLIVSGPICRAETANWAQVCDERNAYLSAAIESNVGIRTLLTQILSDKRPILLLGETHGSAKLDAFSEILPLAQKLNPNLDCLVLENVSADAHAIFEEFNSGNANPLNALNIPIDGYRDVFVFARDHGFKIFPIDDNWTLNPNVIGFDQWVDYRNQFMAKQMISLFDRGECDGIVLSVGAAHLAENWSSVYPTLDARLTTAGKRSHKVLFLTPAVSFNPGMPVEINPFWIWTKKMVASKNKDRWDFTKNDLVCRNVLPLPIQPSALFATASSNAPIMYEPNLSNNEYRSPRTVGHFSDFEGVIIYPPASDKYQNENRSLYLRLRSLNVPTVTIGDP